MDRKLIDYLPIFVQDYAEIKAIMDTEQVDVGAVWTDAENVMKDQFVADATEYGVKRWESILGIVPKATYTLEERKFNILTRLTEQLPYTTESLSNVLSSLCGDDGYILEINYDTYEVVVKLPLSNINNFDAVKELLEKMIPANMVIHVIVRYNSNEKLYSFTHGELAAYTHKQLREENL